MWHLSAWSQSPPFVRGWKRLVKSWADQPVLTDILLNDECYCTMFACVAANVYAAPTGQTPLSLFKAQWCVWKKKKSQEIFNLEYPPTNTSGQLSRSRYTHKWTCLRFRRTTFILLPPLFQVRQQMHCNASQRWAIPEPRAPLAKGRARIRWKWWRRVTILHYITWVTLLSSVAIVPFLHNGQSPGCPRSTMASAMCTITQYSRDPYAARWQNGTVRNVSLQVWTDQNTLGSELRLCFYFLIFGLNLLTNVPWQSEQLLTWT